MRFLVDANLPLSVAPQLRAFGHEATDVREIGLGTVAIERSGRLPRYKAVQLFTSANRAIFIASKS